MGIVTFKEDQLPPKLQNNEEYQELFKDICSDRILLAAKESSLCTLAEKIQATCGHPKFIEERSKKDSWDGINMLVSKTCTECGLKKVRPQGSSYVICENCWGPMEYKGREPGQGGGTQHYECRSCGHHHTHT